MIFYILKIWRGFMKVDVCDVSYNLQGLFEIVGEGKFIEIIRMYGGDVVYFPTYKSVIRASRNRDISKRYNGVNASQLAREYGVSSNQIKRIVN